MTDRFPPGACADVVCTEFGCDRRGHTIWPDGLPDDAPYFIETPCHGMTGEVLESFPPGECRRRDCIAARREHARTETRS